MAEQFFKLSLESAIWLYLSGDLTAKGLVHVYFLIRCQPGWTVNIKYAEVCTGSKSRLEAGKLPLTKSAFYRAIGALAAEKKIAWEPIGGLRVTLATAKNKSKTPHNSPTKISNPKYSLNSAYESFLASLAPAIRSQFQEYLETAIQNLSRRPTLPESWKAKNYQQLWQEFEKQHNPKPSTHLDIDFSLDPDLDIKLEQASKNPAIWVTQAASSDERTMRLAFLEWARRNELLWNE